MKRGGAARRGRRGRDEMEAQAQTETRMEGVVVPFVFGFDFFSFCSFALSFPLIFYLNLCDCITYQLYSSVIKLDRNMLLSS